MAALPHFRQCACVCVCVFEKNCNGDDCVCVHLHLRMRVSVAMPVCHVTVSAAASGTLAKRAQSGSTAAMTIARSGSAICMRQLLDAGADTEAKDTVRGLVRRVRGCLFLFAFSFRIPLTVFFLLFYHA